MSFKKFRDIVYGTESEFGLRELIFHQVCFLSALALSFGILLALNLRDLDLIVAILITQIVLTLSYWLSRVMRLFLVGWILFSITTYALIVSNYFLNAGIDGTTNIVSVLIVAILFATSRSKLHWIWTSTNGLVFSALLFYELNFGKASISAYPNAEARYVDHVFSYLLVLAFMYLIFRLIRRAYEKQQEKVIEQRKDLEGKQVELEKSNTELIKVLSIIAHDVRNPLASIQSFLELSADESLTKDEQKEINASLLHMVQNTSHMLDDMVNWSKIQISGTTTSFSAVSLSSWLNKTVDHLRGIAQAKGVLLSEYYNGRTKLYCDPILMTVIIRNLIQNAVKFTPPGKKVELRVIEEKQEIIFEIEDQGIGIPIENQKRLFSGQASIQSGTQNETGSGFGLMIVKEYVEAHQGSIEVLSKAKEGSLFKIHIPRQ